jgi:hypothetical protein
LNAKFKNFFPFIGTRIISSNRKNEANSTYDNEQEIALLVGGAKSNELTKDKYNDSIEAHWTVHFQHKVGDARNFQAHLIKKETAGRFTPEYAREQNGIGELLVDYGVISFICGNNGKVIIHVAGCTSAATKKGLEALAEPNNSNILCNFLWKGNNAEFPFKLDCKTGLVELIEG